MKKFLFLSVLFSVLLTSVQAQQPGGGDPAAQMQRMKERIKPQLIEKTGLTDAQADKVVEINMESRQQTRGLRDLSEADRTKKLEEIKASNDKKYSEIPLSADQVKAVNTFFEDMRKNMQQRSSGN